jgi:hypothetical protein
MLSVKQLSVIIFSATMLTVVIPIAIILNVVAPIGNWFVLKILFRGYVGL